MDQRKEIFVSLAEVFLQIESLIGRDELVRRINNWVLPIYWGEKGNGLEFTVSEKVPAISSIKKEGFWDPIRVIFKTTNGFYEVSADRLFFARSDLCELEATTPKRQIPCNTREQAAMGQEEVARLQENEQLNTALENAKEEIAKLKQEISEAIDLSECGLVGMIVQVMGEKLREDKRKGRKAGIAELAKYIHEKIPHEFEFSEQQIALIIGALPPSEGEKMELTAFQKAILNSTGTRGEVLGLANQLKSNRGATVSKLERREQRARQK